MSSSEKELFVVSGSLEPLRERLRLGEQVQGRIIKSLGNGLYILRIRGYNFCMESEYPFQEAQDVYLTVRRLYPLIEFSFFPHPKTYYDPQTYRCNLIA